MFSVCVDRRRLLWVVLVGLTALALAMPVSAMATSLSKPTKISARLAGPAAKRHARARVRSARPYHEFGRKVG